METDGTPLRLTPERRVLLIAVLSSVVFFKTHVDQIDLAKEMLEELQND